MDAEMKETIERKLEKQFGSFARFSDTFEGGANH